MPDALVVVEDTDRQSEIVRRAAELTAGVDGTLYLLATVTENELQDSVSTLEVIGDIEHTAYGDETALKGVTQYLTEVAAEHTADLALDFETVVAVCPENDRVAAVCEAAADHDCDHVYAAGVRRSPTGKAVFGDFVQQLLLQFDGYVTADLA